MEKKRSPKSNASDPNTAPVAAPLSLSTTVDEALAVQLAGSDDENDSLTYSVTIPPRYGTLSGSGKNLTYTPLYNWGGEDSFQYKVSDGRLESEAQIVTIGVEADLPDASDLVEVSFPQTNFTGLSGDAECGGMPGISQSVPIAIRNKSKFKILAVGTAFGLTGNCSGTVACTAGFSGSSARIDLNPGQQRTMNLWMFVAATGGTSTDWSASVNGSGRLRLALNVMKDPGGYLGLSSKTNLSDSEWSQLFLPAAKVTSILGENLRSVAPEIRYKALDVPTDISMSGTVSYWNYCSGD
jgi:hypothetical protein